MKRIEVDYAGWGERWHLGTLVQDGRTLLFEYTDTARRHGLELSPLRLPLQHVGAFVGEDFFFGLPGLIADALPDGWGMLLMDRALARANRSPAAISPLERLAFIGERAIGALAFRPPSAEAETHEVLMLTRLAEDIDQVFAADDWQRVRV